MYQITVLDTPVIHGFKCSIGNSKMGGANLTVRVVITEDDTIFHPPDDEPVKICAWLQNTPGAEPTHLSTASGREEDLLWTRTVAEQGSFAIVFRLTLKIVDMQPLFRLSPQGARLRVRADLPRVAIQEPLTASISAAPEEAVVELHATGSTSQEGEGDKPSVLEALLDHASIQTPVDVITIGTAHLSLAVQLARKLSIKMWEAALVQNLCRSLFKPSTLVVADDAGEVITLIGEDLTTERWARRWIKSHYIDRMIIHQLPLDYAVRLRFHHLDCSGTRGGACDRAWSLMIAGDDSSLDESTREATADRIEAVTASSIWHSIERRPPKLLLKMRGRFPKNELSLLDMVRYDNKWVIVEVLEQLPEDWRFDESADLNENWTYILLENRQVTCEYIEVVSPSESESSTEAEQAPAADTESGREEDDTTDRDVIGHEIIHGHLGGSQVTRPATQASDLRTESSQTFPDPEVKEARETQDQEKVDTQEAHEALDSQPKTEHAKKRRCSPEELSSEWKRLHTDGSPEQEASVSDTVLQATCSMPQR